MYSPYGIWTTSATTSISRVARGWSQVSMATLGSEVNHIHAQLTKTTSPPITIIEQTSQFIQQTVVVVRRALKCANAS